MKFGLPSTFVFFAASVCWASDPQLVRENSISVGTVQHTTWVYQVGNGDLNRFVVHRMREGTLKDSALKGAIVLVHGEIGDFSLYTTSASGNLEDSFAGYLVSQGFDVYGLDQRAALITDEICSKNSACSVMADWGIQSIVDDLATVRKLVRKTHGHKKPVVGGFSFGAIVGLAAVNQDPSEYNGLLLWEGMLSTDDPALQAMDQQVCTQLKQVIAAGTTFDNQKVPGLKFLVANSAKNPSAPAPEPQFPSGTTNRQAFLAAVTSPMAPPQVALPGYILLMGSVAEGKLDYASDAEIQASAPTLTNYVPLAVERDMFCSIGGETQFTSKLGAFVSPVLAIQAGHGFGLHAEHSLGLLGSKDVSKIRELDYGHADFIYNVNRREMLDKPVAQWLARVLK